MRDATHTTDLAETTITITVNGRERDVTGGTTVAQLVEQHDFVPEKVAVELNRRLLPAARYDVPLQPGDEVEIVTFVGGG